MTTKTQKTKKTQMMDHEQVPSMHEKIPFPSVLECGICGHQFYRNVHDLQEQWNRGKDVQHSIQAEISAERRAHMKEVFNSWGEEGTPSKKSSHFNAHRAVQLTFKPAESDNDNIRSAFVYLISNGPKRERDGFGKIYNADPEKVEKILVQIVKQFRARYHIWKQEGFATDARLCKKLDFEIRVRYED